MTAASPARAVPDFRVQTFHGDGFSRRTSVVVFTPDDSVALCVEFDRFGAVHHRTGESVGHAITCTVAVPGTSIYARVTGDEAVEVVRRFLGELANNSRAAR